MNLGKFEKCVKDVIAYNNGPFSGEVPPNILNQFTANSKEHLKKYFSQKYTEFRQDPEMMERRRASLREPISRVTGTRNSLVVAPGASISDIQNEARRIQEARASARRNTILREIDMAQAAQAPQVAQARTRSRSRGRSTNRTRRSRSSSSSRRRSRSRRSTAVAVPPSL